MIIINLQKVNVVKYIIPNKKKFKKWMFPIFLKKKTYAITIRIVNKYEIQRLNLIYRKKNTYTNVLTFPYNIPLQNNIKFIGDIVICAHVIYQEAYEQNKKIEHHWAHITIHSALHLLGYHHYDNYHLKKMEQLEIMYMNILGYSNPYII
ncbi:endoribonuclease [Buchnera aphidicola (Nipponaphis monzeni)]|uniref:Endoribonuclease YbeY n=1 Tax=Buchnera aphidicola (Nipponaphis monzeni) TaxID=2495405 RepID=A0A455TAJ7_9GAMM|nr:rRNA maturation RNase YbeY [Buchnera aphidicola]BBI01338.1 endoribonuclease [Buchnera aphidicola (Nipponaphis monzeni)]